MLFYDYEKIWLLSGGDSKLIVAYFKKLYNKNPEVVTLRGNSFMVNPEIIIKNRKFVDRVLAEYIGLCALRNYANYQQTRDTSLDIMYVPDYIPPDVIRNNPLIQIKQNKLIFKEE